jgi:hypothetical protein
LLVLSLLLPASTHSLSALQVDETRSRLRIDDSVVEVALWVAPSDRTRIAVTARVELIDGHGTVLAQGSASATVAENGSNLRITLAPIERRVLTSRVDQLKAQRIEYHVEPDDALMAAAASGVIPALNVADVAFELVATHAGFGYAGTAFPVSVLAFKGDVGSAVRDVVLEAELAMQGSAEVVRATGVSGPDGMAELEIPLEGLGRREGDANLTVVGRRDGFEISLEREVAIFDYLSVLTTTDKPLYRPGEILHARFLLRDPAKGSLDAAKLQLEIVDPEYQRLLRRELTTSRFGVAHIDWPIPDSAPLGDYVITVTPAVADSSWGHQSYFKVSRYDLPAFEVSVAKSAPFYLAGEDAEVHVRADYLFGEPVTSGLVRIGDEEETLAEAELSDDGTVSIPVTLSRAHAELVDSSYRQYLDLELAAYVTDASTGRTEPRKFTVRVSKAPIHVYVINSWNRNGSSPLYVSTFLADGEPAACDVTVESVTRGVPWHRHARTNRFGVAELSGLNGVLRDGTEIVVTARDDEGLEGGTSEELSVIRRRHPGGGRSAGKNDSLAGARYRR